MFNCATKRRARPLTLHISGLRDGEGAVTGLVAVAVDQGGTLRQDQARANRRSAIATSSTTPTR